MSGPRIESVEVAYRGWSSLLKVAIKLPDGATITREVEDHGEAAAVLAYDPVRRVALLVRQLRAPMLLAAKQAEGLEVIAGLLDEDDAETCARREAMEEAGVRLAGLTPIVVAQSMPAVSTERVHCFMAEYSAVDRVGPGGGLGAEGESVTAVEIALPDLARMADSGRLEDAKTLLLVQALRLRRPNLFGAGA